MLLVEVPGCGRCHAYTPGFTLSLASRLAVLFKLFEPDILIRMPHRRPTSTPVKPSYLCAQSALLPPSLMVAVDGTICRII